MVPKTLIIGINTHGVYDVKEDYKINTFTLPPDISMYKIDATCLGLDNMMTLETAETINEKIDAYINSVKKFDDCQSIATNIQKIAKKVATKFNKRVRRDYFVNKNTTLANYIYHLDKTFSLQSFTNKSLMLNKRFVLFTEEQIEKYEIDIDSTTYFNQIVIYNMDSLDIMELVQEHFSRDEVYLSEIVDLLVGMGAQNLIFVDLSCNTFLPTNPATKLSERDIRNLRRKYYSHVMEDN